MEENQQPMQVKDWLLTTLLLCIPVANVVLMFFWAFGSNVNKSKKSYFQAQLIIAAVVTLLWFLFLGSIVGGLMGSSSGLHY